MHPAAQPTAASVAPDDLPDGLVVADRNGCVAVFNRAAEGLTGLRSAEAIGRPLSDALPLTDAEGRGWWACVDAYGGLRTRTGHPERALALPGGRELLVSARYVRTEPLGEVDRVVVALRSSRAREREELSRAELVSTVAHELRSPLTGVKGFTATLLAKWDRFTDEQKRLMLETVDADADQVTRLITELLDTARIDSGRLELLRHGVDVNALVDRHVARMVAAGVPRERIQVEVRPGLPELWADADKLDQVLANLLENALRHGAGTITLLVEPATLKGEPATAVTVMDEGRGISPDHQRRVFTKFWRSGGRGGTGLGLYIVRGLVAAHDGVITIGSSPVGGALFRFVLPAGVPEAARHRPAP